MLTLEYNLKKLIRFSDYTPMLTLLLRPSNFLGKSLTRLKKIYVETRYSEFFWQYNDIVQNLAMYRVLFSYTT